MSCWTISAEKCGERRQSPEQAGDQEQTPFRGQARTRGDPGQGRADGTASGQVGRKRAQRDRLPAACEPDRQPPAAARRPWRPPHRPPPIHAAAPSAPLRAGPGGSNGVRVRFTSAPPPHDGWMPHTVSMPANVRKPASSLPRAPGNPDFSARRTRGARPAGTMPCWQAWKLDYRPRRDNDGDRLRVKSWADRRDNAVRCSPDPRPKSPCDPGRPPSAPPAASGQRTGSRYRPHPRRPGRKAPWKPRSSAG